MKWCDIIKRKSVTEIIMNKTFSVIGVGNIARAFISALSTLSGKFAVPNSTVTLYNRTAEKINDLKNKGYKTADNMTDAVNASDIIFLGIKPQNLKDVFGAIKADGADLSGKMIVSPCAGVTCADLCALTGCASIIRIMPNTPMQIGKGVTEICRSASVSDKDFQYICRIFSMCGEVITVNEEDMNSMTAATSSAVALVYRLICAFTKAAEDCGAKTKNIEDAVAKTFIGAAEMLITSDKSADELVAAVRSPKGATEQALLVFDNNNIDGIISEAVKACADRCKELGEEYGK